jgi:glycosyltransferase involved in cell wall biosynthesis
MVVGLDCFPLRSLTSGTEEYIEGLVRGLWAHGVTVTALGGAPLDPADPRLGQPERPKPTPWAKWWWETRGLAQAAARTPVTVVHIPYLAHPPRPLGQPTVVTVHDLIPYQFPGYGGRARDRAYFRALPARLGHATRLVAVSVATRDAVAQWFPLWLPRLSVIANGVHDAFFAPPATDALHTAQALCSERPAARRVLYVGNYQPHKNVPTLLQAFSRLPQDLNVRLILVGSAGDATVDAWVRAAGVADRVDRLPRVNRPVLRALYELADVFAFPSRLEGFGLPPAQALAAGVPCAVSETPAVAEVVGDAALRADPDDIDGWAANLTRLLDPDDETARRLVARGRERAQAFRWAAVAEQYRELYAELAS